MQPRRALCLEYFLLMKHGVLECGFNTYINIYLINTQIGACSALHALMLLLVVIIINENS